jgi:beta-glucosidase
MKRFFRAGSTSMFRVILQSGIAVILFSISPYAQTPVPSAPAQNNRPQESAKPPYLDPKLPIDRRVNALISRMTLEENVSPTQDVAAAILDVRYPGEEGGTAVADMLSGDYNPSGRLPVTFYTGIDQLPPFENYSMAGRTYRYFSGTPLSPFGFGLSFTKFAYANARADREQIAANEEVNVSVDVKNTGAIAGGEVVQLYVTHPGVSGAPIRALAGFTRIHLAPGEQRTVTIPLRDRQLSIVDENGKRRILTGLIEVSIGGGQPTSGIDQTLPAVAKTQFRITTQMDLPD